LKNRINELLKVLKERKVDFFIITNIPNLRYIANFTGSSGACIISQDKKIFITDTRYREQAEEEVEDFKILIGEDFWKLLKSQKVFEKNKYVGFEAEDITLKDYIHLAEIVPSKYLKPLYDVVAELASNKSDEEIGLINKAVQISEAVFHNLTGQIKPKVSEKELKTELVYQLFKAGSESLQFDPIVLSGERTSLVHGRVSDRIVNQGDILLFDFGAVCEGYGADLTRMVFLGTPSRIIKEAYNSVIETISETIKIIQVSKSGKEIDDFARKILKERGFSKYFIHPLGHGIGMKGHYKPLLSKRSRDTMKPKSAFSIEPGIYIKGEFGIRVEENILLKENECKILSNFRKEPLIIE